MNIIDAIKSGRRFRRPCFVHNWMHYPGKNQVMLRQDGHEYYPCKEDILADDWETEEKKVEITKGMLIDAVHAARCEQFEHKTNPVLDALLSGLIAKRLGLE